jgi:uncharacterized membrane protein
MDKLKDALYWSAVFVAIAITIACGVRIVDWITEGNASGVWKVALVLIGSAVGGGSAASALQKIRKNGNGEPH